MIFRHENVLGLDYFGCLNLAIDVESNMMHMNL